jgi:hypothetical protein
MTIGGRLFVSGDSSFNGPVTVNGLMNAQRLFKNISAISIASNATTIDMNVGCDFYVASPSATNFKVNFINVPAYSTNLFVVNLYINTNLTNLVYGNAITISSTSAVDTTVRNNSTTYVLTGAKTVLQTFSFLNGSIYVNVVPFN